MKEECESIQILLYKMNSLTITQKEYQYLQFLLMKYEMYFRNYYPVGIGQINDGNIMYISDTHFGGKDENKELVYTAYNLALRWNIKTVVHAGDLTEAGANNNYDKPLETVREEIITAISYMPNEIITKLLIGNHDYSAIRTYNSLIPLYFSESKLEILGMKKAILKWIDTNIGINHHLSQIQNATSLEKEAINIYGHFHHYLVEENKNSIKLPPLCDDNIDQMNKELAIQGFTFNSIEPSVLVATRTNENTILFEFFGIEKTNYTLKNHVDRFELNTKTNILKKYK